MNTDAQAVFRDVHDFRRGCIKMIPLSADAAQAINARQTEIQNKHNRRFCNNLLTAVTDEIESINQDWIEREQKSNEIFTDIYNFRNWCVGMAPVSLENMKLISHKMSELSKKHNSELCGGMLYSVIRELEEIHKACKAQEHQEAV